jgi:hypothetical protein
LPSLPVPAVADRPSSVPKTTLARPGDKRGVRKGGLKPEGKASLVIYKPPSPAIPPEITMPVVFTLKGLVYEGAVRNPAVRATERPNKKLACGPPHRSKGALRGPMRKLANEAIW